MLRLVAQGVGRHRSLLKAEAGPPIKARLVSASGRRGAEDDDGVEAAEGERVRHGVGHLQIPPDVGCVVEVALGIGIVETDGRRNPAFLHAP